MGRDRLGLGWRWDRDEGAGRTIKITCNYVLTAATALAGRPIAQELPDLPQRPHGAAEATR